MRNACVCVCIYNYKKYLCCLFWYKQIVCNIGAHLPRCVIGAQLPTCVIGAQLPTCVSLQTVKDQHECVCKSELLCYLYIKIF